MSRVIGRMKPSRSIAILIFAIVLPISFANTPAFSKTYRISTMLHPPFSTEGGDGQIDNLLREAFFRVGHDVEFSRVPTARAVRNASIDLVDGHMLRFKKALEVMPELLAVPHPILKARLIAVSVDPKVTVRQWDDLAAYSEVYPENWLVFASRRSGFGSSLSVLDPRDVLRIIKSGRAKVGLFEETAMLAARHQGIDVGAKTFPLPGGERDTFLVLKRELEPLAIRLADVIGNMRKDGSFRNLCRYCYDSLYGEKP